MDAIQSAMSSLPSSSTTSEPTEGIRVLPRERIRATRTGDPGRPGAQCEVASECCRGVCVAGFCS